MVDRVELVLRDQALDVRELQRDDAFRFEKDGHASDEVVEVRNLREHVVADDEVGLDPFRHELPCEAHAEEIDASRYSFCDCRFRDVRGGLDTKHRDAERLKMLEQIAVVAGKFDCEAFRSEVQAPGYVSAIRLGVSDPTRRE